MRLHSFFGSHPTATAARETALPLDRNNPAEPLNPLGTVCEVHHCARMLGEAPVMEAPEAEPSDTDFELQQAKRASFPHSWRVLATFAPRQRHGWFARSHRARSVAVRYCEYCRAAAEQWLREHLG